MAAFRSRDREAFVAHWAKLLADPTKIKRTVLCDERVAGNVLSWEDSGEREIGYWIGREFWGRGVATRAVSLFLREVTARPLIALVAVHNVASVRVLEKCGFAAAGRRLEPAGGDGATIEFLVLRLD